MEIPQQQTIFQLVVKNTHTFWMELLFGIFSPKCYMGYICCVKDEKLFFNILMA